VMKVTIEEFDGYVEEAIGGMEEEFSVYLREVPVVVEDEPVELIWRKVGLEDGRGLLGLFQGVPLRVHNSGAGAVSQIILYRKNILRMCRSRGELAERIRRTIVHELGHYLGFSEGQLREYDY